MGVYETKVSSWDMEDSEQTGERREDRGAADVKIGAIYW